MRGGGENDWKDDWSTFYAALARLKQTVERLKLPAAKRQNMDSESSASSSIPSSSVSSVAVDDADSQTVGNKHCQYTTPKETTPKEAILKDTATVSPNMNAAANDVSSVVGNWMPEDYVVAEDNLPVLDPWQHDHDAMTRDLEEGEVNSSQVTEGTQALPDDNAGEDENTGVSAEMKAQHMHMEPVDTSLDAENSAANASPEFAVPLPTFAPPEETEGIHEESFCPQLPQSDEMVGEAVQEDFSPVDASTAQPPVVLPEPHTSSVMDEAGWIEQDGLPPDNDLDEWELLEGLHDASVDMPVDVEVGAEATFREGQVIAELADDGWLEHDLPDAVDDAREDPFAAHAGGVEALQPDMGEVDNSPLRSRALDLALEIADLLEDLVTQSRIVEAVAWLETFFMEHPTCRTREAIYRLAVSGCTFGELRQTIALRNLFMEAGWNLERRFDRLTWTWEIRSGWLPTYAQALELVRARRDYPLDMMVDTGWLDEWQNLQPGAAGFARFIDFACMKAGAHAEIDDLPLFAEDGGDTCAEDNGWHRRLHLFCPGDRDDPAPPLKHVLPRLRCGSLISLPPPGDI